MLDVAALTGDKGLRVWLRHRRFDLGGARMTRTTRIDLQRRGGYAGTVDLGASGLPGSASVSFTEDDLEGLTGLGTRMTVAATSSGPDGSFDARVTADGTGGHGARRRIDLAIDRTGPRVTDLVARLRAGRTALARDGTARLLLRWRTRDPLHAVTKQRLQRRIGTQPWRAVGTTAGRSMKTTLKPGRRVRFRVNAMDALGNQANSKALSTKLLVRDSDSARWTRPASGGWRTKRTPRALGGSMLQADARTDGLTTSFTGSGLAIVAPVGPGRGTLRLRIDGGSWTKVRLGATSPAPRRVVFSRRLSDGTHRVEIEGYRGRTALDALLILR